MIDHLLNPSSISDFEKVLEKYEYEKSDFELTPKDYTDYNPIIYVLNVVLTIKRLSTNKKMKLYAGNVNTWVRDFELDLIAGEFS